MKYAELKDTMAEFRLGHITRKEMVAAFALWQRPVDTAIFMGATLRVKALEAVIR